jgi:CheY-like chemotaxis protein
VVQLLHQIGNISELFRPWGQEFRMYDILIVDDDLFVLALLEEQLKNYGDFFTPVYANNGKEAVEILTQVDISLLVTDLIMPGDVNGWHLIEYIESFYPNIPIVVMTGCTDHKELAKLKERVRQVLLKPIKVEHLVEIVTSILNEDITVGSLKGISVGAFLQLLEIDRRTCLLEVGNSPKNKGLLYIHEGKLYDAEYGDLREQEAACHLIALDNVSFEIKALPRIEIRRRIKSELMSIIMQAMQMKDENHDYDGVLDQDAPSSLREHGQDTLLLKEDDEDVDDDKVREHTIQNQQAGVIISPPQPQQEKQPMMTIDTFLDGLRWIKGYKASALMNFTGEILIADSIDSNVDLENIGPIFNDVLRDAEEAAEKIGLEPCLELTLKTSKAMVVMCCSGLEATIHFHLIVILEKDGNQALAKLELAKLVPLINEQLS